MSQPSQTLPDLFICKISFSCSLLTHLKRVPKPGDTTLPPGGRGPPGRGRRSAPAPLPPRLRLPALRARAPPSGVGRARRAEPPAPGPRGGARGAPAAARGCVRAAGDVRGPRSRRGDHPGGRRGRGAEPRLRDGRGGAGDGPAEEVSASFAPRADALAAARGPAAVGLRAAGCAPAHPRH